MKKLFLVLALSVMTACSMFALGGKTSTYELIPVAPCEFEIRFANHDAFMAFVNGHADFVEVRFVDEATLSAGIYIDETYGMCLAD